MSEILMALGFNVGDDEDPFDSEPAAILGDIEAVRDVG